VVDSRAVRDKSVTLDTLDLAGRADSVRVEDLLAEIVSIHSVNPSLDGGPGEGKLAQFVAAYCQRLGFSVDRQYISPDRFNVIVQSRGNPDLPVLAYEAHMDTVPVSSKARAAAVRHNGKIYGRGACDTKGSLVAMLESLRLLGTVDPYHRCTVVFAATVDEEVSGDGARQFLKAKSRIDFAVVGEPTGLSVAIAHKGLVKFSIRTRGVAAHASKPELGVNAIEQMSRVIAALESEIMSDLRRRRHPLVGSPTMVITGIDGGRGSNVIPTHCRVDIDRRLNPGESVAGALSTVDLCLARLRSRGVDVARDEPSVAAPALDLAPDHILTRALTAARRRIVGTAGVLKGMPFGSDGSTFVEAGVPAIVFGPGNINQAHSDDEWVDIAEVAQAAEILAALAIVLPREGSR
jgi:succinyl-diaminopimelate desuccinylase